MACSRPPEPIAIVAVDDDPEARAAWFEAAGATSPADSIHLVEASAVFAPLVAPVAENLDSVERVLGHLLANRKVKPIGVISPYSQAIITHPDGYLFIGINHYLGAQSPAYKGFPQYLRQRKEPAMLPVDVAEAILAAEYPAGYTSESTLLNHMLYKGALLNCMLKALPEGTPEARVLAMTPDEYAGCVANEARIWKTLIERNYLYSSQPEVINRLMRPAPASTLISNDAPGQAVLFTALKIAQAYEKATGREALPVADFYNDNQTLVKSNYTPANATR